MQAADEHVDRKRPKFRTEHLDADEAVPAAVEQRPGEPVQFQDALAGQGAAVQRLADEALRFGSSASVNCT
jgi:hypothetical protein